MFIILKTCFTKKAQDIIFLNIKETEGNRPKMQTFVKHVFLNLKHTSTYATRRALSNHHEKNRKKPF
jgi:hypothetical protein